jgi:hypothetical protein
MIVEAVAPKVRGGQPNPPADMAWRREAGLWVPGENADPEEVAAYLEWRDQWAEDVVIGLATGLRTILERAGTMGEIAIAALGINQAEHGHWTHLSISDVVTAAAALGAAEDEMERAETWTPGPVLPALRRAVASASVGGELWVGPLVNRQTASSQH